MGSREENFRDALEKALPGKTSVHIQRARRVWVTVKREDLREVATHLAKKMKFEHIATISAADVRENIEVNYHFFHGNIVVTLKVPVPKTDPKVPSITDIFPGAILYEREFHDFLGVVPEGHPDLRRIFLPEKWMGGHPLRKDWTPKGYEAHVKPKGGE
jgi:membrane-bound hydrogenase subunit beta